MNKILVAVAALVAMTVSSFAADLPVKAPVIAAAPSWSGFYVGGHVGGGWMEEPNYTFADPGNAAFASCSPCIFPYSSQALKGDSDLFGLAGAHIGYNLQIAPSFLVGIEGDFSWMGARSHAFNGLSTADFPAINGSSLNFSTNVNWVATVRGRLGYTSSNWMVYATGGVAWADVDHAANAACPAAVAGFGVPCVFTSGTVSPFSINDTKTGWVAGVGAEYAFAPAWRARIEYLYYSFDTATSGAGLFRTVPGGGPLPCIVTPTCSAQYTFGDTNLHTVRAGVSYAFRP